MTIFKYTFPSYFPSPSHDVSFVYCSNVLLLKVAMFCEKSKNSTFYRQFDWDGSVLRWSKSCDWTRNNNPFGKRNECPYCSESKIYTESGCSWASCRRSFETKPLFSRILLRTVCSAYALVKQPSVKYVSHIVQQIVSIQTHIGQSITRKDHTNGDQCVW